MRIVYRVSQFWRSLANAPATEDLTLAQKHLQPALMALFTRLQDYEQAHSLLIYRQLREQNESNADLLAAALLHDVGKSCHPLHPRERIVVVLGKAIFSKRAQEWGQGPPRGWRRPFVVAEQHPIWGAEMAAQAGASPMTVTLINRHHEAKNHGLSNGVSLESTSLENHLLYRLQSIDNES